MQVNRHRVKVLKKRTQLEKNLVCVCLRACTRVCVRACVCLVFPALYSLFSSYFPFLVCVWMRARVCACVCLQIIFLTQRVKITHPDLPPEG